jgi:hypothetical protein
MIKTFRKCTITALAVFASVMLAGCADPVADPEPSGVITPGPGAPGGGTGSGDTFPIFDINNLPSPAQWNRNPEIVNLPNPFIFADGTPVTTETDWTRRRVEISKILQYYYQGLYPPQPETVTVSGSALTATAGTTNANLTITVTAGGKTGSFTLSSLYIPATAPNGEAPSATNKIPLMLCVGASTAVYRANGFATIDFGANSDALTGIVNDLFAYSAASPDRPNSFMREAWRAARILDAFEILARDHEGVIDPDKFLVSGMSRWGKDALYIGAFAESMSGKKVAVTNPVSSGGGAIPIDRFTNLIVKKVLYIKDLADDKGGTPHSIVVNADDPDAAQLDIGTSGIETHWVATGLPEWFGKRFFDFADLYPEWDCDQNGSNHGIIGTAPFDSHFVTSLVAPRALMIHEGWQTYRGNPEANYFTYLATKEVYHFLDAEQNVGIRMYTITHSNPTREQYDLVDFANYYFNSLTPGLNYARLEGQATYPVPTLPSFGDNDPLFEGAHYADWFDVRNKDPKGRFEYLKLNWASPKKDAGSSVADQVKANFDSRGIEYPGQ